MINLVRYLDSSNLENIKVIFNQNLQYQRVNRILNRNPQYRRVNQIKLIKLNLKILSNRINGLHNHLIFQQEIYLNKI